MIEFNEYLITCKLRDEESNERYLFGISAIDNLHAYYQAVEEIRQKNMSLNKKIGFLSFEKIDLEELKETCNGPAEN